MPLLQGNLDTLRHRLTAPLLGVIPPDAAPEAAAMALDRSLLRQMLVT